ncbi:MAG: 2-oxoacid:acceptor oxidoreductase family protein [Christensenellaceae bacterium]|jgi:2-oxoglutarate ferredoxin oxidoreductase subunit gamma|nr:2-oxoacid:acceptor oxidoreductase family protein [Christensenellaceae bacterium]
MIEKMFFAGSGGQGIILMGQMITYAAMYDNKAVTFLPSYGPEMRGGTANCTVVISDKPVSCPLVYEADVVVAMNLPSLTKFESLVKPGGKLFVNTSLIDQRPTRTDIQVIDVPANDLAAEMGNGRAANMIMLGAVAHSIGIVADAAFDKIMQKTFSGKKAALLDLNRAAFHAVKVN